MEADPTVRLLLEQVDTAAGIYHRALDDQFTTEQAFWLAARFWAGLVDHPERVADEWPVLPPPPPASPEF